MVIYAFRRTVSRHLGAISSFLTYHILMPSIYRKRESISLLVYKVCENNWVNQLMTFNFSGFANEVEDALAFKARNVDPRLQPSYSRILYSWYLHRGDYRNGK